MQIFLYHLQKKIVSTTRCFWSLFKNAYYSLWNIQNTKMSIFIYTDHNNSTTSNTKWRMLATEPISSSYRNRTKHGNGCVRQHQRNGQHSTKDGDVIKWWYFTRTKDRKDASGGRWSNIMWQCNSFASVPSYLWNLPEVVGLDGHYTMLNRLIRAFWLEDVFPGRSRSTLLIVCRISACLRGQGWCLWTVFTQ